MELSTQQQNAITVSAVLKVGQVPEKIDSQRTIYNTAIDCCH